MYFIVSDSYGRGTCEEAVPVIYSVSINFFLLFQ